MASIFRIFCGVLFCLILVSCNENPPQVKSVDPEKGYVGVRESITINGKNFSEEDLAVELGDASVEISKISSQEINAEVSADLPGVHRVVVTNADGSSAENVEFEFLPSPVVSSVFPDSGLKSGRTIVCISGENLAQKDMEVRFSGKAAKVLRSSDNELVMLNPNGEGEAQITFHFSSRNFEANAKFDYSGETDLGQGHLVTIKDATKDDGTAETDFQTLVDVSNDHKDQLITEHGRCGLQLGKFLDVLPHIHLLNAEEVDIQNFRNDPKVEAVSVNEQMSLQIAESRRLVNLDHPTLPTNPSLGTGTTVVVADSGVDYTVAPFSCDEPGPSCSVKVSIDIAPNDGSLDADPKKHGTNVSAIVKSIAPGASIIALDVTDGLGTSTAIVLDAINWAINNQNAHNIVAINLSLSGLKKYQQECFSDPYGRAAFRARLRGINIVASSGNNGWIDGLPSPACSPAVISVGAVYDSKDVGPIGFPICSDSTTAPDKVTCFSNFSYWLSMLAPGSKISAGGVAADGTSQAAPHVAAAIAAIASTFPSLSPEDRKIRIEQTGTPVEDIRVPDGSIGSLSRFKRRLDMKAAHNGELYRPKPPTKPQEAWPVPPGRFGAFGVVADTPVFDTANNGTLKDKMSGIDWWPERSPTLNEHLQRAGYRCSRYPENSGAPFGFMRLPTRAELVSLIDPTRLDGFTDSALGPNMNANFWSVSPSRFSNSSKTQWQVNFEIGFSALSGNLELPVPTAVARHRCVVDRFLSNPAPQVRFVSDDVVVDDNATGLKWMRSLSPTGGLDYEEASAYCAGLTAAGENWRVPTFKELVSLMSYEPSSAVDPQFFEVGRNLISSSVDIRVSPGLGAAKFLGLDERTGLFKKNASVGNVRCVVQRAPGASSQRTLKTNRTIKSALELQALKAGDFVSTQSLYISTGDDSETLVLPGIREINGDLIIDGSMLKLVWFPDLERISGDLQVSNNKILQQISFPKINQIDGSMKLSKLPALSGLEEFGGQTKPIFLPRLENVGGVFSIQYATLSANSVVEFFALQSIDNHILFTDNTNIGSLILNKLSTVGASCNANPDPFCGTIFIERNQGFVGVRLLSLASVENSVFARNNAEMTSLSIVPPANPGFTRIPGTLEVTGNKSFCAARLNTVIRAWPKNTYPSNILIANNRAGSSCVSGCSKFPPNNSSDCPIFTNE